MSRNLKPREDGTKWIHTQLDLKVHQLLHIEAIMNNEPITTIVTRALNEYFARQEKLKKKA